MISHDQFHTVIWVSVVGPFQSEERSMLIRRKQVILICLELYKNLKVSLAGVCAGPNNTESVVK